METHQEGPQTLKALNDGIVKAKTRHLHYLEKKHHSIDAGQSLQENDAEAREDRKWL